jgi:formylglycine-generating enzyme required for sulfatase activity
MSDAPDLAGQIASLRATLAIASLDPQTRAGLAATLRALEAEQARPAAPVIHAPSAQRDLNIATQQTIHNYGAGAAPDLATLRREYLLGLSGACSRLSLADADSSNPARAAIELASVYTRLEVTSTVPLTKQEQQERLGQQQRQLAAIEALAQQPRLVLLGDPGGGKSTLVNFVGLCLARAALGEHGWLERLGAAWPHGALTPIRVVLREFAAWLAAQPQPPNHGDAALLWDWLEHTTRSAPLVAWLRAEVSGGRALLLLDGLDEVPSDAQGQPLARVRETLLALKAAAGASRVLVTCRVLDYQQPQRQLAGWPGETIIPFSDDLRQEFIGRWYAVLAELGRLPNGDAATLCERLRAEVRARPELRRLAGNPLLLTMMTLLHAYEGRLPDERVRLYEKCIEFLLLRWRPEHGEPALRAQLDLPEWSESDLGRLLDRLGFAAHTRGVSGDGESGADLPYAVLIETARAFFAGYDAERAFGRAETFCRYVSRFGNGVLQKFGPDTYRFPHRTFQEYLAARRLTGDGDWGAGEAEFVERALARAGTGPQWREALLLAASRLVVLHEQIRPAADLAEALLDEHPERTPAWARGATLAGEVLGEVGKERLSRLGVKRAAQWERTQAALVTVLEHQDSAGQALIPTIERVRAGYALAQLGDPRFPVELAQWRGEAYPAGFGGSGYWQALPAGTYAIGGWEEDARSVDIALSAFWIARYPVTVAQFAPFVTQGYGPEAEHWWTLKGWRWKQKEAHMQPWLWDDPRYTAANQPVIGVTWYEAMAFCAWLSEQLAETLPAGYVVRLPSEAEWEVAASAALNAPRRTYPWGEAEPTPERAIYDASGLDTPAPVGVCPAGAAACGALDLAGNVWEWCGSRYKSYPALGQVLAKDFPPDSSFDVLVRGGGWRERSTSVRCGARVRVLPLYGVVIGGFRLVVALRSH